jgi:hypothetical protein
MIIDIVRWMIHWWISDTRRPLPAPSPPLPHGGRAAHSPRPPIGLHSLSSFPSACATGPCLGGACGGGDVSTRGFVGGVEKGGGALPRATVRRRGMEPMRGVGEGAAAGLRRRAMLVGLARPRSGPNLGPEGARRVDFVWRAGNALWRSRSRDSGGWVAAVLWPACCSLAVWS